MFAAAAFLLLVQYSATAQSTDSLHTQNADSLITQNSSGPATVYSIQQCIDSALKYNYIVKTADFTAQTARVNYLQQIGNMLPSLYGTANYLNNGGKSIDNYTNTYVTENYNQGTAQAAYYCGMGAAFRTLSGNFRWPTKRTKKIYSTRKTSRLSISSWTT